MTSLEPGIHIVSIMELKQVRKQSKKPVTVYFINRRKYFQPYPDTMKRYDNIYRRFSSKDPENRRRIAMDGSSYENMYRRKIMNTGRALAKMRTMAEKSREKPVYLVSENDFPDARIIKEIVEAQIGNEIW
uniref:Uncharacterized protein n=1 Tax=viral metagenome TaxID=1070528 RepID=A0A6M3K2V7_9ZZZZ